MRTRYILRKGNQTGEISKSYRSDHVSKPRAPRSRRTDAKKQQLNRIAAARRLARILDCNFQSGSYMLTLTYSSAAIRSIEEKVRTDLGARYPHGYMLISLVDKSREDLSPIELEMYDLLYRYAQQEVRSFLRRVKRRLKAEVYYVYVTGNLSTKKAFHTPVRIHHHVILRAEGATEELLKSLWKNGKANTEMVNEADKAKLARYLLSQVAVADNIHRYTGSRNLVAPVVETYDTYAEALEDLSLGATLVECVSDILGEVVYQRFALKAAAIPPPF